MSLALIACVLYRDGQASFLQNIDRCSPNALTFDPAMSRQMDEDPGVSGI
jgi:hypothetical protein